MELEKEVNNYVLGSPSIRLMIFLTICILLYYIYIINVNNNIEHAKNRI